MSIRKILVGTDFSASAQVAVDAAVIIARNNDAHLVLAHAFEFPPPDRTGTRPISHISDELEPILKARFEQTRDRLNNLAERLAEQGLQASPLLITDFADEGISKAAVESDSDLTILGTHGYVGLQRLFLGSAAERIVRLSERNTLVVRGQPPSPPGYRKVLVPVDFSDYGRPSLELALKLIAGDGEIEVFHAWELLSGAESPAGSEWTPLRSSIAESTLALGREMIARAGLADKANVTFVQQEVPAHIGIQKRLEAGGHDLVVMGSHGRRGVKRFFIGSIAEKTVRHAPCSVLVVRHKPENRK